MNAVASAHRPWASRFLGALGTLMLVSSAAGADDHVSLEAQLDQLMEWFPGEYDNHVQVYRQMTERVPPEQLHRQTHHIFHPVSVTGIPEPSLYAQQSQHYDRSDLYRQRIYSFSINADEQAIQLTIYTPQDPSKLTDAHLDPGRLAGLTANDFVLKPGCEVFWTWDGTQYNGYLKENACSYFSTRFDTQVYLNETLTLRRDALVLDDTATDGDGNLVFGAAEKGPTVNLKQSPCPD
ncbi:MAG: chromophore lyase CpcT/CpeT [Pseudomonadota bacterium]